MKLNYITIQVSNLEESVKFYKEVLHLSEQRRIPNERGGICFVANANGETQLELIEMAGRDKVQVTGLIMSFRGGCDLEGERSRIEKLGYAPSPLQQHGAKPTYFTVPDPDGMLVEIS